jgi:hypothetical protein
VYVVSKRGADNHAMGNLYLFFNLVINDKKKKQKKNNLGWYFVKAYAIMCSIGKMNTLERQEISCRYYTKAQEEKKKP